MSLRSTLAELVGFEGRARLHDDLVACANCRYPVSRARGDGVCPECAHPVAHSIEVASSAGVAARRVERRLALGLALAGLAVALMALATFLQPPWTSPVASWAASVGRWVWAPGVLLTPVACVVLALAAPPVELRRPGDRSLAIGAILLCAAVWIVVVWTWVPAVMRSGGLPSLAELLPRRSWFNWSPWRETIAWTVFLSLVGVKCVLDRRGAGARLGRWLGTAAIVAIAVSTTLFCSHVMANAPLPITGFPPGGPPWWWLAGRAAEEERFVLIEFLHGAGLLLMFAAVVDVAIGRWRTRYRPTPA